MTTADEIADALRGRGWWLGEHAGEGAFVVIAIRGERRVTATAPDPETAWRALWRWVNGGRNWG